jgi:hypothetical protein
MNSADIARIRRLAQELLALVAKLEAKPDDEEGEEPDPSRPVAPLKPRSWKPVIRPGGLCREDEIELALEHVEAGLTATDIAKLVLVPGEQYGKKHYAATYAALKWLQEHVEIEQKGKLWSLTAKGRARPDEIRRYLVEYRGWKGEAVATEAASAGSAAERA